MIELTKLPEKICYIYKCKCANCYGEFECTADEFKEKKTIKIRVNADGREDTDNRTFSMVACPYCNNLIAGIDYTPNYYNRYDDIHFRPRSTVDKIKVVDLKKSVLYQKHKEEIDHINSIIETQSVKKESL